MPSQNAHAAKRLVVIVYVKIGLNSVFFTHLPRRHLPTPKMLVHQLALPLCLQRFSANPSLELRYIDETSKYTGSQENSAPQTVQYVSSDIQSPHGLSQPESSISPTNLHVQQSLAHKREPIVSSFHGAFWLTFAPKMTRCSRGVTNSNLY